VSDAGAGLDAAAAADASTGADADPPREAGPIPDAGPVRDAAPLVDARTDAGVTADEAAWTQTVKPVAERACFGCHGSVGAASVSLTTYASWVTNRNALRTRVITQRNMPPNASSLSAADRAAIGAWLGP
jgi:mono/diheme cytochrome c family protein